MKVQWFKVRSKTD